MHKHVFFSLLGELPESRCAIEVYNEKDMELHKDYNVQSSCFMVQGYGSTANKITKFLCDAYNK